MRKELAPQLLLKVSISLNDLEYQNRTTPDLFDDYQPRQKLNGALSDAIDNLNKTYGAQTVTIGTPPKTSAGYVGTKIAFNRIPEREEFHE